MLKMEKLLTSLEIAELNKFGKLEFTASHVYQFLTNRMKSLGYFGAEAFFLKESLDERTHYNRIAAFMNDMNCELSVEPLDKVSEPVNSIGDALELAYQMEADLLAEYEKTSNMNISRKVLILLQDLIMIQVGAVGEYGDLINRLKLTDNMLVFDADLLERSENEG
jgi:ferritin